MMAARWENKYKGCVALDEQSDIENLCKVPGKIPNQISLK